MEENRDVLKRQRERYRTEMFRVLLELVFIFGVPAIGAFFAYKFFSENEFPAFVALLPLVVAFALSWVITIYRVRSVSRKLKAVEEKLHS